MGHPDEQALATFVGGGGSSGEREEVEAHLDTCSDCRALVSDLVRQRRASTPARRAPTEEVRLTEALPSVGDVIDGRYRVARVLGKGGMGCVYDADQIHLNQKVALKLMLPEVAADPQAVDRFLREARAAALLRTPHVCRVLDLGTLASGTPYLAMEYLRGETVAQRLARAGRFSVEESVLVMRETCEALEEAHRQGIIHRDLKPQNLFLAEEPSGHATVKVLDFGIAKSFHPDVEKGLRGTTVGVIMGSPQYMAPEQVNPKREPDARIDLWALGVVLYQMLSGALPFEQQSVMELAFAIVKKPHVPLEERVPSLPAAVVRVVDRCLAKDPDRRFPSVASFRAALESAASEADVTAPAGRRLVSTPSAASAAVSAHGSATEAIAVEAGLVPARWRVGLALGAVALIAAGGLVGLWMHEEPAVVALDPASDLRPGPEPEVPPDDAGAPAELPEPPDAAVAAVVTTSDSSIPEPDLPGAGGHPRPKPTARLTQAALRTRLAAAEKLLRANEKGRGDVDEVNRRLLAQLRRDVEVARSADELRRIAVSIEAFERLLRP